jgi:hypothetical protein
LNHTDTARILEELVDSTSVMDVLEALATVCYDKAEHLRSNWPDLPDTSAMMWERAATKILGFHARFSKEFKP